MTTYQAAERLAIGHSTIFRWIATGYIEARDIGYRRTVWDISKEEVDRILNMQTRIEGLDHGKIRKIEDVIVRITVEDGKIVLRSI